MAVKRYALVTVDEGSGTGHRRGPAGAVKPKISARKARIRAG